MQLIKSEGIGVFFGGGEMRARLRGIGLMEGHTGILLQGEGKKDDGEFRKRAL